MIDKKLRARTNINLVLFGLVVFFIVVIVFQLFFHLYLSPNMEISSIKIVGELPLANDDLLLLMDKAGGRHYYSFKTEEMESLLLKIPSVETVKVSRRFPDGIKIVLKERSPLMLVLAETENGVIPAAIDREGLVYKVGDSIENWNIPILSGFPHGQIKPGMHMPPELFSLFISLNKLRKDSLPFFNIISEVRVDTIENGKCGVTLFLTTHPLAVKMGDELTEDMLGEAVVVMDALLAEGVVDKYQEIDFRTDRIILNKKVRL